MLTALLVLGTAGPMLFAAKQASAGRALVSKVFGGNKTSAVVAGRYNVLLLGGDAGKDRSGLAAGQHDAREHRCEHRADGPLLVPAQHAERAVPSELADAPGLPQRLQLR